MRTKGTLVKRNDDRGRPRAIKIRSSVPPRAKGVRSRSPMSPWVAVSISALFLIGVSGLAVTGRLPWIVPLIYMIASVVTVVAYAIDKNAAMNGRWRTQESTLHLFALAGGWPGAWISQRLFRHKNRKSSFMAVFIVTVLINLTVLIWAILEPYGPLGNLLRQIGP